MKVGYGVTVLSRCIAENSVDGIGSYTNELLSRFHAREDVDIVPFSFNAKIPSELLRHNSPVQLSGFAKRALYSGITSLPFFGGGALSEELDLVHSTDHLIPKLRKIPVVATLMDAIPLSHPEWVTYKYRALKNALWRKSSHWAEHIITISEYSKSEIVTHFGVSEKKITVIPLAVDQRWFSVVSAQVRDEVSKRLQLPKSYYLFVGTLQPRKNIRRVIEAHQSLPCAIRAENPLIIVGREGWDSDVVDGLKARSYGDNIRWLQYINISDLYVVVSLATGLVFPSLHEGFGLPVLEAMAAGTPVVTSNNTSLPEVAGDAALLIDPLDVTAISDAMLQIVEDELLASELKIKG
ncbi:MAG TPA: glycosyltransferase family 1 protein, partial [Candidatus Thioglobus sp.]|nr:glycosyltransferase family 1 protein [Candidatus Thioglobus sp.]